MRARMLDLGLRPYREVWRIAARLHERVREGSEPDTWIFVEHPPVITLGRTAKRENVLFSPRAARSARHRRRRDRARRRRHVSRAGTAGRLSDPPARALSGNRPARSLARRRRRSRRCARFGVTGERWSEHAGVWVGTQSDLRHRTGRVARWSRCTASRSTRRTQLDYDRLINPCGLPDRGDHLAGARNRTQRIGVRLKRSLRVRLEGRSASNSRATFHEPSRCVTPFMTTRNRSRSTQPAAPARKYARKPDWLRVSLPCGDDYERVQARKVDVARAQHRLQRSGVPEPRGVLGRGHRDDHDSGRYVHAGLPLLQRQDGESARRSGLAGTRARRRCGARPRLEVPRADGGGPRRS